LFLLLPWSYDDHDLEPTVNKIVQTRPVAQKIIKYLLYYQ
jgi:hypothetical protein